jgi:SAM-dependent methyltransferase
MIDDCKSAWEDSYSRRDNFLFHPHEEVIRFVSKYIRKRVGLDEFVDVRTGSGPRRILDLGCGIGRHVLYCQEMGLDPYGVDLSELAVTAARGWAASRNAGDLSKAIVQGDVRQLPWADGFFHYALSHGVLDSMPYEIARAACVELARAMAPQGLFYCDLVSGDDSKHSREFSGAERVTTAHEQGTMQLYFNFSMIETLFQGIFELVECNLIRREEVLKGGHISRYHLVLRKP